MIKHWLALVMLSAVAAPLDAQVPAPKPKPARSADNEMTGDAGRMICRTESETGSLTSRVRRCMTAAQWAAGRADNRQTVERAQTQLQARPGQ